MSLLNITRCLKNITGTNRTEVKFTERPGNDAISLERLCEAVGLSFKKNIVLDCKGINCKGALYTLGYLKSIKELARNVSSHSKMPLRNAQRIIASTVRLETPVRFIELGKKLKNPDLFASCLTPFAAMKLLRRFQIVNGTGLETSLSTFMAVCSFNRFHISVREDGIFIWLSRFANLRKNKQKSHVSGSSIQNC